MLKARGGEMAEITRGERLQIMLTPEELEALDTWRFAAPPRQASHCLDYDLRMVSRDHVTSLS